MLNIPLKLLEKFTLIISCTMILGLFFVSYPSDVDEVFSTIPKVEWIHTPVIMSISMVLFFCLPFWVQKPNKVITNFILRKDFIFLSGIFIYLLIGFINSDNYSYLYQRLQIKLPFLLLPIAAASLSISKKSFDIILTVFLVCCFTIGLYTIVHYIMYFEQINVSYLNSKVMPTPMNHVRFSILSALAVYTSYYLIKNDVRLFKFDRPFIIFAGLFLFVFVHLYSVRSGLLALYALLFTEIIILLVKKKAYKSGLLTLSGVLILGVLSIIFSPTIKNKISNSKQDISVYKNNGNINYNSLSTRIISYKIALDLFNENKLLGCGLGDLEEKNTALFKAKYPEIKTPIIPHNEFLYYLAGMGILGLLSFSFCFLFPLFYKKNYLNEFLLMHYIVLFLSFQSEPMIETQLGVACTLIFIILPLMVKKEEVES